jgi:hypothetical protein
MMMFSEISAIWARRDSAKPTYAQIASGGGVTAQNIQNASVGFLPTLDDGDGLSRPSGTVGAAEAAKHTGAERTAIAETEKIVAIWNARQAGGRALWFYPTIGAAIAAGLPWLTFFETSRPLH